MNVTDYTYLLNKPEAINERYAQNLDEVLATFPYFQSARVLRLKHLYNQDSYHYNYALKICAGYTADRSVLFDFITSDSFVSIQKGLYEKKLAELMNMNVVDLQVVAADPQNPFANAFHSANAVTQEEQQAEKNLEIGRPLEFSKNEKHSFQEWLQLSRIKPIERETKAPAEDESKKKKLELIDKFIETNPKIPQITKETPAPVVLTQEEETSYIMTETLARVYLEQKKYTKAIQAYEILILKYPEKSSLFADRIADIRILQQNNNQ